MGSSLPSVVHRAFAGVVALHSTMLGIYVPLLLALLLGDLGV
jgi:hypothetical protein